MITIDTRVWTKRGWRWYDDLIIGEEIISYNESKGFTEYDKISSMQSDWKTEGIIGLRSKSMDQKVTLDHPLLVINRSSKELERIPAKELFFRTMISSRKILYNRGFEPYNRTQDIDDISWSARYVASFAQSKQFDTYPAEIFEIIKEFTAIEAQKWIDVFVHWNIKRATGKPWGYIVCLRNHMVRDMLFHVAPRAGIGVQWSPYGGYAFKPGGMWAIKLSSMNDNATYRINTGWWRTRYEGLMFNITTQNGSFLARTKRGTFIMACNKIGE